MQNIKISPKEPIDTQWYARLVEATKGIGETFIILEPEQDQLQEERQKFFDSNCQSQPDLRPRNLDSTFLAGALQRLIELRTGIHEQEPNKFIREAYEAHIADYVTNLEMIHASVNDDHAEFIAKNVALYGVPHTDVFAAVCTWIREDVQATMSADGPQLEKLGEELLRLLPDISGDPSILLPREDIFKSVRDMHFTSGGYFDQLFAPKGLPDSPYVDQLHGDDITLQAIANVGSDYEITSATDGLWAVLSRSHQIVRPEGYRVDRDYFTGIVAHEIGSHLLAESNGSRQSLRLLELGMNGYEKGSEGLAYLREQIVYPHKSVFVKQASWEYILILHLSVSLAAGLTNRRYTFVELYALLYALHRFWRERRYPLDTNNEAQAREEAWFLGVRIMKGTDGSGGSYMKDTVYLQGSIACWKLAERDSRMLLLGDVGKFNVADPRHWDILRGLGILPAAS